MADFNKDNLINLDECVINALNLFISKKLVDIKFPKFKRPLIVGSGNALVSGKIMFESSDAVFADESTYKQKLDAIHGIDGAILISASGGKHAPIIAKELKKRKIKVILLTTNENAEAKEFADKTFVTPKNTEPYTYNTSTYLGMILSHAQEDPKMILDHIQNKIEPFIPDKFANYDAIYILVPDEFDTTREMFLTKFDELFGSKISGRVFTPDQTKHAKTVVPSDTELFIGLGVANQTFGKKHLNFTLPVDAKHASIIAIGYYIIGKIQRQNKPYYKENILEYTKQASKIFGSTIKPIVD